MASEKTKKNRTEFRCGDSCGGFRGLFFRILRWQETSSTTSWDASERTHHRQRRYSTLRKVLTKSDPREVSMAERTDLRQLFSHFIISRREGNSKRREEIDWGSFKKSQRNLTIIFKAVFNTSAGAIVRENTESIPRHEIDVVKTRFRSIRWEEWDNFRPLRPDLRVQSTN